jgi:hypothetical protein
MVRYRVYLLDDLGKIFHGADIEAPDDAAAVASARSLIKAYNADDPNMAHGLEVWLGTDLIFSGR